MPRPFGASLVEVSMIVSGDAKDYGTTPEEQKRFEKDAAREVRRRLLLANLLRPEQQMAWRALGETCAAGVLNVRITAWEGP